MQHLSYARHTLLFADSPFAHSTLSLSLALSLADSRSCTISLLCVCIPRRCWSIARSPVFGCSSSGVRAGVSAGVSECVARIFFPFFASAPTLHQTESIVAHCCQAVGSSTPLRHRLLSHPGACFVQFRRSISATRVASRTRHARAGKESWDLKSHIPLPISRRPVFFRK